MLEPKIKQKQLKVDNKQVNAKNLQSHESRNYLQWLVYAVVRRHYDFLQSNRAFFIQWLFVAKVWYNEKNLSWII